jgi:hypothetical protein
MKAKTFVAAMTLLGMPALAVAQPGPATPREPAASGAIVVPPGTGDSETMQKAPPAVVDPRMTTPPPAVGKDAQPDTTRPKPAPDPSPAGRKKSSTPS